jgi:hypothetical protein
MLASAKGLPTGSLPLGFRMQCDRARGSWQLAPERGDWLLALLAVHLRPLQLQLHGVATRQHSTHMVLSALPLTQGTAPHRLLSA